MLTTVVKRLAPTKLPALATARTDACCMGFLDGLICRGTSDSVITEFKDKYDNPDDLLLKQMSVLRNILHRNASVWSVHNARIEDVNVHMLKRIGLTTIGSMSFMSSIDNKDHPSTIRNGTDFPAHERVLEYLIRGQVPTSLKASVLNHLYVRGANDTLLGELIGRFNHIHCKSCKVLEETIRNTIADLSKNTPDTPKHHMEYRAQKAGLTANAARELCNTFSGVIEKGESLHTHVSAFLLR